MWESLVIYHKNMETHIQDRIRGSLIGGAVGDALGYPVEFVFSIRAIQSRYGEKGITRLDTHQYWLPEEEQAGKAVFSDDTQMTLYSANGLLNAKKQKIAPKLAQPSVMTLYRNTSKMTLNWWMSSFIWRMTFIRVK